MTHAGQPYEPEPVQTLLDRMEEGVCRIDSRHRICYANRAAARILGIAEPHGTGADLVALFGTKNRDRLRAVLSRALDASAPVEDIAFRLEPETGAHRHCLLSVWPLPPEGGEDSGFSCLIKDRTREHHLEKDLAVSQAGLEKMITSRTLEMKEEIEQKRHAKTVNSALFAISTAIHTTNNLDELYPIIHQHLNEIIRMDHFYIGILDKDGQTIHVQYRKDPGSRPLKYLQTLDMETTIAGRVIRESVPLLLERTQLEKKRWDVKRFGPIPESWMGVPLSTQERTIGVIIAYSETDYQAFSQEDVQLLTSVSSQVAFAIERRYILDKLHYREAKYRSLVETTTAGYWQMDVTDITTDVNPALCRMLGYEKEEIIGRPFYDFIDPQSRAVYHREADRRKKLKDRNYELVFRKKDGGLVYSRVDATSIFARDGRFQGSFGVITDITDRILFQKELHKAKERAEEASNTTRTILEKLQAGMVLINADTHVIEQVNPAAARMFGRPAEQIVGNVCNEYLCPNQKGSCPITDMNKVVDNAEKYMLDRDGNRIPILKTVSSVTMKGQRYLLESFVDITEQKKAEEKLLNETDRANEMARAAQEANRAKSQFIANMSHEIRTPLNGVIGMTELILESGLEAKQAHLAGIIGKEADALLSVVNAILDFSKIEAGKMELESIPFNLRQLFDDFSQGIAVQARKKGLGFSNHLDPDIPAGLCGDPGRLRQVFTNLAGNALKFTHQGEITITGTLDPDTPEENASGRVAVRFEVTDTGIGIPAEKQDMVFQSFSQVDGSTSRLYGGTGLGTTISKQLVEMMGGRIGVESRQGEGSRFWFTAVFDRLADGMVLPDDAAASDGLIPEGGRVGIRVLLVEDYPTNQQIARRHLERAGFDVTLAESGARAVALFGDSDFHLILMDIQMPGMDGYEATDRIRKIEAGRRTGDDAGDRVPIIATTAHAMEGYREKCLAAGMDDYLTKPLKRKALVAMVTKWADPSLKAEKSPAAESTEPQGMPPIDMEKALAEFDDDREFLDELIRAFMERLARQIAEIEAGLETGDYQPLSRHGHTIKGGAANLMALDLSEAARQVEEAGLREDGDAAAPAVKQLGQAFGRFKAFIQKMNSPS